MRIALLLAVTAPWIASQLYADEPAWQLHTIDRSSQGADGVKLADINGDGRMDIATGWEEGGITRVYVHPGAAQVTRAWPAVTVGRTASVEDAVFADLNADGRWEVVSCLEGKTRTIHVHWPPDDPAALLDASQWKQQELPAAAQRMQWMFAWAVDVDGKHGIDLVAGGKGPDAELGWFESPSDPHQLDQWQWHPITPVGWVMSIWPRDMDDDGDLDMVVSDRYGEGAGCRWLENPGAGPQQSELWQTHWMGARGLEVLSMTLADLDDDGLQDAVVAVKQHQIRFLRRLDASGRRWEEFTIGAHHDDGNTRAVEVADVNLDGQLDLVYTTWNSQRKHGVRWLSYRKQPTDPDWEPHVISGTDQGIKYDRIELVDLDNDGDLDLLTCEEREGGGGLGVIWYENPFAQR